MVDPHTRDGDDVRAPRSWAAETMSRNAWLIGTVLVVLAASPSITRLIENYRGVVLERRDHEALTVGRGRPPVWREAPPEAVPGTILRKEAMAWSPTLAEAGPEDAEPLALYQRYRRTYAGVVVRMQPPVSSQVPWTAVLKLDGGELMALPLWSPKLAGIGMGSRVEKRDFTWDPDLLDGPLEAIADPASATPAARPAPVVATPEAQKPGVAKPVVPQWSVELVRPSEGPASPP